MRSQNFFDNNNEKSAVILEDDEISRDRKNKQKLSPQILAAILIVCAVIAIFGFLMAIPPKQPKADFVMPDSAAQQSSSESLSVPESSSQAENVAASGENSLAASEETEIQTPIQREEWYLKLVNAENPLPEEYGEQEMTAFGGGYYFDERIIEPLEQLLDAAQEEGLDLKIVSGYRGVNRQTTRNENEIAAYQSRGYTEQDAVELARMEEPPYRECEHSLGLAVDLLDRASEQPTIAFDETDEFAWLKENAAEYGFILRYPEDKVEQTGMVYEPWHFRYVGKEDAQKMMESGLCLEEYLAQPQA